MPFFFFCFLDLTGTYVGWMEREREREWEVGEGEGVGLGMSMGMGMVFNYYCCKCIY